MVVAAGAGGRQAGGGGGGEGERDRALTPLASAHNARSRPDTRRGHEGRTHDPITPTGGLSFQSLDLVVVNRVAGGEMRSAARY